MYSAGSIKKIKKPGTVANPRYFGDRDWEDHDWRPNQAKNVHKTSSHLIKAGCGGVHLSSELYGKGKEEDSNPGQPRLKCETLIKNYLRQKGLGGVAQVMEYLPSKCKALR
jgi:hypothetical protein